MKQRQRSWRPALIGVAGLIAGYYLVPSRLAYDALCSIMGIAGVGLIRPSHNPDRRTRRVCHRLLIGAITAMFVADFSFGLLAIHDAYQTPCSGRSTCSFRSPRSTRRWDRVRPSTPR
jgi:hypothetical protein